MLSLKWKLLVQVVSDSCPDLAFTFMLNDIQSVLSGMAVGCERRVFVS